MRKVQRVWLSHSQMKKATERRDLHSPGCKEDIDTVFAPGTWQCPIESPSKKQQNSISSVGKAGLRDWGHVASAALEISTWSPRVLGALSVSSSGTLNCCHRYVLEKVSELFEHIESMGGSWLILEAQLLVLIILIHHPTHQGSLQHKGETIMEIEGLLGKTFL